MERKTVIKLSGSMAQRFGRTHRRALTSASEVFRALSNTIDGFDAYLREARAKGLDFVIFRNQINIGKEEFDLLGPGDELRIIPVIRGSKGRGSFKLLLPPQLRPLLVEPNRVGSKHTNGTICRSWFYGRWWCSADALSSGFRSANASGT